MQTHFERSIRTHILPVTILILLLCFIVYPALTVFLKSFEYKGQFGLGNYLVLFTKPYFLRLIRGSVLIALGSAFCSTLLGLILAITVFKTNLPFRRLILISVGLPMILPGFVTSLSYIFLFGRNGLITYKLLNLTWEIYSWKSVLILQTLGFSTTTFFLISAVLVGVNEQVEDAARDMGACEWQVLTTVTLPLISPGLKAALLLSFLRSMADFGTPFIVGGRFNTLATLAYTKLIGTYDTGMASSLSIVLLFCCMIAFWLYSRIDQNSRVFRIEKQVNRGKPLKLSYSLNGFLLGVGIIFSMIMLGLLVSILMAAFTRHLGMGFHFTLEHFNIIPQQGWNSIRNTVIFAVVTCFSTTLLGIVIAYLVSRVSFIGKNWLDFFATLPFAIPGTFMGVGYALAFNSPPLILSGTWMIVVVCTVVRELPLGFRSGDSILAQQDRTIEQASEDLGASKLTTFVYIILPLVRPALVVSAIYSFIATTKTLGAIIFLITPSNKVLAVDVFEATIRGDVGNAAAFSVILMLIAVVGVISIGLVSQQANLRTRFRQYFNAAFNSKSLLTS